MIRTSILPPIRVAPAERDAIRRFASVYNLTLSEYVRLSALQLLREEAELRRIYARRYKA